MFYIQLISLFHDVKIQHVYQHAQQVHRLTEELNGVHRVQRDVEVQNLG